MFRFNRQQSISLLLIGVMITQVGCGSCWHRDKVHSKDSWIAKVSDNPISHGVAVVGNVSLAALKLVGGVLTMGTVWIVGCWLDDDDEDRVDTAELWRQGYGFNNPNAKRKDVMILNPDGTLSPKEPD